MTRQRLLLASLLAVWMSMVIACGEMSDSKTAPIKADAENVSPQLATDDAKAERKRQAEPKPAYLKDQAALSVTGTAEAPKPITEEKASLPPAEAPHPTPKLIPIKSYPIVDAWHQASALKGKRVRLTGEAEVKRTGNGVYAVFRLPSGLRIAIVSVKNDDAGPLRDIKVGKSKTRSVNLETTVEGAGNGWYMALADSEFLPLDAPEGFVSLEEPPVETRSATTRSATTTKAEPSNPGPSRGSLAPPTISSPASTSVPGPGPIFVGTDKPVHVRGYYRKDGTYVRSHSRAAPGMGTHHRR